ncbi:hypothetical protein KA005_74285, partial [bacterium]|nr:hypothetical protein [bacterium]
MAKEKSQARRKTKASKVPETAVKGAEFHALRQDEMDTLLRVLKENEKALRAHKGVYKVDVGYRWKDGKMTGEIAIRVHVKKKRPINELEAKDIVPKELAGFPVDVVQSNIELHRTTRHDPIIGGVETRNVNIGGVGTLGAVVFNSQDNQPMALSNHHVYVDNRANGAAGERV